MLARAEGKAALKHVLDNIFQLQSNNPLAKALTSTGISDIHHLLYTLLFLVIGPPKLLISISPTTLTTHQLHTLDSACLSCLQQSFFQALRIMLHCFTVLSPNLVPILFSVPLPLFPVLYVVVVPVCQDDCCLSHKTQLHSNTYTQQQMWVLRQ